MNVSPWAVALRRLWTMSLPLWAQLNTRIGLSYTTEQCAYCAVSSSGQTFRPSYKITLKLTTTIRQEFSVPLIGRSKGVCKNGFLYFYIGFNNDWAVVRIYYLTRRHRYPKLGVLGLENSNPNFMLPYPNCNNHPNPLIDLGKEILCLGIANVQPQREKNMKNVGKTLKDKITPQFNVKVTMR